MNSAEQEFEKILDEITNDLFDAKYQSYLYRNLMDLRSEYEREFNQTVSFWSVVLNALRESSILSLTRAYDQHGKGVHLDTLIKFIYSNVDLFTTENFRERLKDNVYVDSLAKTHRVPSEEQLNEHAKLVVSRDSTVKKLIQLRNNIIAHKSKSQILGSKNTISPLTWDEFDELVERGFTIRNYYSDLYNASTYAANALIGKDDYQVVVKYLRIALMSLNFVNRSGSYSHQESFESVVKKFTDEVHQEIYKRM